MGSCKRLRLLTKSWACKGLEHTEELLGAAALLNHLHQSRLQLLDRRHVLGKDTHLPRLCRKVDLDDVLGLVDGLRAAINHQPFPAPISHTAAASFFATRSAPITESVLRALGVIPGEGALS